MFTEFTKEYNENTFKLWEKYIKGNEPMPDTCDEIRPVIYESWKRCRARNISPLNVKDEKLDMVKLDKTLTRSKYLVDVAHSYILNLYGFVKGSNFLIALTDEQGYVIDLIGQDAQIQAKARQSGLSIGSNRSEKYAGTNGIGTCLYTGQPIQIWGTEHYIEPHHKYVCSAAPIKNADGVVIGCLDLVGPVESVTPHTLGMVCAAVDGIEKEIQMRQAYEKMTVMNNQLSSVIQSISSGILMVDNMGIITHHNRKISAVLKIPSENLTHKNIADILDLSSSSASFLKDATNVQNREVSINNYLGVKLNLSISSTFIYNDSNERISTVFVIDELQRIHTMITKMSGFTARYTLDSIIGTSPAIENIKTLAMVVAQSDSNALILGESGTGKELLAQSIHNASSRSNGPFIAINCGSLPMGLVESELFGYERGAFTGANKDGYPGKFELAQGGTLFLDEIGDMPLEMQASLLRVIQTREIVRIGGKMPKSIDVRIIAATNVNLIEFVKNNKFRSDLYYRLNVLSLIVPPLRERTEDLLVIAHYFIDQYNKSMGKNIQGFSEKAKNLILSYDWPGNIRELENIIERAMTLTFGPEITEFELTDEIRLQVKTQEAGSAFDTKFDIDELPVKVKESELIKNALSYADGNVSKASIALGMPKRTLYRKIEKYKIDVNNYRV